MGLSKTENLLKHWIEPELRFIEIELSIQRGKPISHCDSQVQEKQNIQKIPVLCSKVL